MFQFYLLFRLNFSKEQQMPHNQIIKKNTQDKNKTKIQSEVLTNEIEQLNFLRQNVQKMQASLKSLIRKKVELSHNPQNNQAQKMLLCQFFKRWDLETQLILRKLQNDNNRLSSTVKSNQLQTSQEVAFSKKIQELYIICLNGLRFYLRTYEKKRYEQQNFNTHKQQILQSRLCLTERIATIQQPQPSIIVIQASTKAISEFQRKSIIIQKICQNYRKRVKLQEQLTQNKLQKQQPTVMDSNNVLFKIWEKQKIRNDKLKKQLKQITKESHYLKLKKSVLEDAVTNLKQSIGSAHVQKAIRDMIRNNTGLSSFYDIPQYFKYVHKQLNSKASNEVKYITVFTKSKSCPKYFKPMPSRPKVKKNMSEKFDGGKSVTISFIGHLQEIGVFNQ